MPKEYQVLKVDEMVRPGEISGVERYYRATIKTHGGTVLTVDLQEADFSAEKAGPVLAKAALAADQVLRL